MNTPEQTPSYRQTAVNTFAVIGLIALIILGIWGAIYSARFVPTIANRIGTAAVYVGSLFVPAQTTPPTSSDTNATTTPTFISFGSATTTASTTPTIKKTPATTYVPPKKTSQQVVRTATRPLYGLPDLSITVTAIGYLSTDSTSSFVSRSSVPSGERPAITFTVKNIGTNASGPWRFSADIPTRTSYTYRSDLQQSLAPGDSIDYIFGFDRASVGTNQNVTITTNYDNVVKESNTRNDSISLGLTIH